MTETETPTQVPAEVPRVNGYGPRLLATADTMPDQREPADAPPPGVWRGPQTTTTGPAAPVAPVEDAKPAQPGPTSDESPSDPAEPVERTRRHLVRRVVTHPASKAGARHAVYVGYGTVALATRRRDARSTARHERFMRAAEAAGDHETALAWEDRARKFRQERHHRRMALIRAVPHAAKAAVVGTGITVGGLLALGIILAVHSKNPRDAIAPILAVIASVRWCVAVFELLWGPAVLAAPFALLLALWNAGRKHAALSTGWVTRLQPAAQDAGIVVTADGIVQALKYLGIGAVNAAFKDGWLPTFITSPVKDGRGYRCVLELPLGVTPGMVADQREKLARNLHRAPIEVWASDAVTAGTGKAGCLDLWVADPGVLNKPAPEYPLLHSGTADVFEGVPAGVTPRGDVLLVPIVGNNFTAGGMMGQGKSNACRVVILGCALDPLAELWVHVFAGNGDFDAYAPRLARYERGATDEVAEAGLRSLEELYAEVGRREARLAELGAKKVTRQLAKAHPDLRPIVALYSECHELFGHREYGEQAADVGVQTIRRARKTAITLMFDTQSSRKEAIPPKIVELVSVNSCFAVKSWRSNDGFLGDGSFAAGIRATELRPTTDRGTSLITGVSDASFEILKWFFVAVDDDTGWDAASDVIARAVASVAKGTLIASNAPAPAPVEQRDLLDDLDEVLGSEVLPVADVPPLLRKLAPAWRPYASMTGKDLREQLAKLGVRVPSTGNRWPLDPAAVRRALARRSTADLDEG